MSKDAEYFLSRAEAERRAAEAAGDEEIAEIHSELARLYEILASHPRLRANSTID